MLMKNILVEIECNNKPKMFFFRQRVIPTLSFLALGAVVAATPADEGDDRYCRRFKDVKESHSNPCLKKRCNTF